jgi:hypothetical protein
MEKKPCVDEQDVNIEQKMESALESCENILSGQTQIHLVERLRDDPKRDENPFVQIAAYQAEGPVDLAIPASYWCRSVLVLAQDNLYEFLDYLYEKLSGGQSFSEQEKSLRDRAIQTLSDPRNAHWDIIPECHLLEIDGFMD